TLGCYRGKTTNAIAFAPEGAGIIVRTALRQVCQQSPHGDGMLEAAPAEACAKDNLRVIGVAIDDEIACRRLGIKAWLDMHRRRFDPAHIFTDDIAQCSNKLLVDGARVVRVCHSLKILQRNFDGAWSFVDGEAVEMWIGCGDEK